MKRDDIQAIARSWIGTPYHHQAAIKGVGCDCLGLLRGLWFELGYRPISMVPHYPQSWPKTQRQEYFAQSLAEYLRPIPLAQAVGGDVVLCRLSLGGPIVHAGILVQHQTQSMHKIHFIHAHSRFGVQETPYEPLWVRLAQLAFRFPQ